MVSCSNLQLGTVRTQTGNGKIPPGLVQIQDWINWFHCPAEQSEIPAQRWALPKKTVLKAAINNLNDRFANRTRRPVQCDNVELLSVTANPH